MKAVWRIPRWIAVGMIAIPLAARSAEKPTESEHRRGPHGLEGWTLDAPVPDSGYGDERFAFTLVLARDGHVLHRIGGDPFIWKWLFWADGRQVAYETGPFHFGMTCILVDVRSGRKMSSYDCYHELPVNAPEWAKALESAE
jgi:hypothetical protein